MNLPSHYLIILPARCPIVLTSHLITSTILNGSIGSTPLSNPTHPPPSFCDIHHSIPLTRAQRDDRSPSHSPTRHAIHDAVALREHPVHTHRPRDALLRRRETRPSPPLPPSLYHPSSKFLFMASSVTIRVSILALPPIPRRS